MTIRSDFNKHVDFIYAVKEKMKHPESKVEYNGITWTANGHSVMGHLKIKSFRVKFFAKLHELKMRTQKKYRQNFVQIAGELTRATMAGRYLQMQSSYATRKKDVDNFKKLTSEDLQQYLETLQKELRDLNMQHSKLGADKTKLAKQKDALEKKILANQEKEVALSDTMQKLGPKSKMTGKYEQSLLDFKKKMKEESADLENASKKNQEEMDRTKKEISQKIEAFQRQLDSVKTTYKQLNHELKAVTPDLFKDYEPIEIAFMQVKDQLGVVNEREQDLPPSAAAPIPVPPAPKKLDYKVEILSTINKLSASELTQVVGPLIDFFNKYDPLIIKGINVDGNRLEIELTHPISAFMPYKALQDKLIKDPGGVMWLLGGNNNKITLHLEKDGMSLEGVSAMGQVPNSQNFVTIPMTHLKVIKKKKKEPLIEISVDEKVLKDLSKDERLSSIIRAAIKLALLLKKTSYATNLGIVGYAWKQFEPIDDKFLFNHPQNPEQAFLLEKGKK